MLFNIIDFFELNYKKKYKKKKRDNDEYYYYYQYFIKWLLIIIIVSVVFIIINNLYYNTLENHINKSIIENPTTPSDILRVMPQNINNISSEQTDVLSMNLLGRINTPINQVDQLSNVLQSQESVASIIPSKSTLNNIKNIVPVPIYTNNLKNNVESLNTITSNKISNNNESNYIDGLRELLENVKNIKSNRQSDFNIQI